MKRIFFITRSDLSAVPNQELALPALVRAGYEVTVAGSGAADSAYRRQIPFPCHVIDMPVRGRVASELALMKQLLRARHGSYDALYLQGQALAPRAAIAMLGPKFSNRLLYHNSDYFSPIDHPLRFALERRLCRKADLYVNAEFHRAYITAEMYGVRCPVLTLPANLPRQWPIDAPSAAKRQQMTGGNPDAFVLMAHGGYSSLRMTQQLLQALATLPSRFRLVMTGGSPTRDTVDEALEKTGIADRVVRLPRLQFQEMLSYSVNADAGVLLYKNSDLGNFFQGPGRLTEYLACGLPLLSSDHTGLDNLVRKFNLGESADATNPQSIAEAIVRVEQGIQARVYSRAHVRQVFEDHLAFDHWESVFLEAFEAMFEGKRHSRGQKPPFPWLTKGDHTPQ
jgi:glycosyltransferase involved in cell wall biosynthesis